MTRVRHMRIRKRRLAGGTAFQLDYVDPITHKRIRKHFPSAVSTERYYAQQTLDAGTRDPVPAALAAVTLARYAAEWVGKQAVASRTIDSYRDTLRLHIVPVLGPFEVRAITRGHIRALLARKRTDPRSERDPRPLGKHSVRLIRATLSVVLGDAVADGIIEKNPAHVLAGERRKRPDRLSRDERRKTIKPLSVAELETLLGTAETACTPRDWVLLLTLADSGLRPGEALALQWDDVDEARKTLTVERALSRGRVKTTKTESTRTVDLTDRLVRALSRTRPRRKPRPSPRGACPGRRSSQPRPGPSSTTPTWRGATGGCSAGPVWGAHASTICAIPSPATSSPTVPP
jgi:integrase